MILLTDARLAVWNELRRACRLLADCETPDAHRFEDVRRMVFAWRRTVREAPLTDVM